MDSKIIKLNKIHYILLFLFLILWLFIRSNNESLSLFNITEYKYTSHLINYEYEFLKRGLIGEILRLIFEDVSMKIVSSVSFIFLLILSILLFNIYVTNFNKKPDYYKLIFSITIFTSPVTIQHLIYDAGRYDIINLIITLSCFFIIEKLHKKTFSTFVFIGLPITLMLFIHEAAFFMFVPIIFGYWFFKNSSRPAIILQVVLFILITFLTFKISNIGLPTKFTLDEYYSLLVNKGTYVEGVFIPNPMLSKYSISVFYGGIIDKFDNNILSVLFKDAMVLGFSKYWLVHNFFLITLLSPLFYIVFIIFRDFYYSSRFETKIFLLSGLSPLFLYFIAYDHMRWWALTFINIFLIFFKISKQNNFYSEVIKKYVIKYKNLFIFLIIQASILGPAMNFESFDIVLYFLKILEIPLYGLSPKEVFMTEMNLTHK